MPPFAVAPPTEPAERALPTIDGRPSRDGALLTQRLQRHYHDLPWNPPVVNADLGLRASARSHNHRISRIAVVICPPSDARGARDEGGQHRRDRFYLGAGIRRGYRCAGCGDPQRLPLGSVAATWQRFGRAGRRQQPALGVLVASSQPLDQYVVRKAQAAMLLHHREATNSGCQTARCATLASAGRIYRDRASAHSFRHHSGSLCLACSLR